MGVRMILIVGLLASMLGQVPAADNPYQAITARNVFGLKDPPPPPNPEDNKPPPPKITRMSLSWSVTNNFCLAKARVDSVP